MSRPKPKDILKAVVKKLLTDPAVTALVNDRVYNHVPQDQRTFPLLQVRLSRISEWDTQTSDGLDLDVLVDVVTNFDGDEQALEVGGAVFDCLHRAALTLDGGQQCLLVRYYNGDTPFPADGLCHRYNITFHLLATE